MLPRRMTSDTERGLPTKILNKGYTPFGLVGRSLRSPERHVHCQRCDNSSGVGPAKKNLYTFGAAVLPSVCDVRSCIVVDIEMIRGPFSGRGLYDYYIVMSFPFAVILWTT